MAYEVVLIDWAGTITVPMHEMVLDATKRGEFSDDMLLKIFGAFSNYHTETDSPMHRAERGEIDDDELIEHFNQVAPGAGALMDINDPACMLVTQDRPAMIQLLEDLQENDVMVFLATNNFRTVQDMLATLYLDNGLVSAIVNSSLVGTRKPDAKYFELCLEAAGCDPSEAILLDDQQRNLDAAEALGITPILVEADETPAVTQVRSLFGLE